MSEFFFRSFFCVQVDLPLNGSSYKECSCNRQGRKPSISGCTFGPSVSSPFPSSPPPCPGLTGHIPSTPVRGITASAYYLESLSTISLQVS